jgi:hypothetical protein
LRDSASFLAARVISFLLLKINLCHHSFKIFLKVYIIKR